MGKSTINYYEGLTTEELQELLIKNENELDNSIIDFDEDKEGDFSIDVSLIRIELSKRLWYEE